MVRPVKLPEERKENILRIRLTDDERAALDLAAKGRTSTWARRVLIAVAKKRSKAKSQ